MLSNSVEQDQPPRPDKAFSSHAAIQLGQRQKANFNCLCFTGFVINLQVLNPNQRYSCTSNLGSDLYLHSAWFTYTIMISKWLWQMCKGHSTQRASEEMIACWLCGKGLTARLKQGSQLTCCYTVGKTENHNLL